MRTRRGSFSGARGTPIVHREWLPDGEPAGTVVVVHGINEHAGRYQHVAERLVDKGWLVAAPDHRGHGLSGGRRAAVEQFEDYIDDLDDYLRVVLAEAPRPRFLLGHSLGGLIAVVYALHHPGVVDGLVLSAPGVVRPRDLSSATLRFGRLASRYASNIPLVALPLDQVSRDPEVVTAYRSDPLVHLGRVRARTGAEILDAIGEVERRIGELALPLLLLQGTCDRVVDPGAATWVDANAGSADRTLRVYDGLYHEVLNEPEREQVIDDVVRWLDEHGQVGRDVIEPAPMGSRSA